MRKFLIGIGVLLLVLVITAAVLMATFDADRYRPLIAQKLEQSLGKPVRIQRVSAALGAGLQIEVKGLSIFADEDIQKPPAVLVEKIEAAIRLKPLLQKKIEIDGIKIRNGELRFVGRSKGSPQAVTVGDIEASAKNISLGAPLNVGATFLISGIAEKKIPGTVFVSFPKLTTDRSERERLGATGNFSIQVGGGTLKGKVRIPHLAGGSRLNMDLAAEGIDAGLFFSEDRPDGRRLQGHLSGVFRGSATAGPSFRETLSGEGRLAMPDGVLLNVNVLREVFGRLAIIPGAVDRLNARLPDNIRGKLATPYTVLAPLDIPFTISNGWLVCNHFQVATEDFLVWGSARAAFNGTVEAQLAVRLSLALSQAAAASVEELQVLINEQGQIEFPLRVVRFGKQWRFLPNMRYLTSRLIATQGQALISDLLQKKLSKK